MMGLCTSNRPDASTFTLYNKGTLTSCFEDTFLLPVFSWILILVLLAMFAFGRQKSFSNSESYSSFDSPKGTPARLKTAGGIPLANLGQSEAGGLKARFGMGRAGGAGKSKLSPTGPVKRRRVVLGLMCFFLVANFAMHILEIARLSSSGRGIGLLPFLLLPLLLSSGTLFLRPHSILLMTVFCVYFGVMAVVSGVKTNSLARFRDRDFNLTKEQKASFENYHWSDWILDVGVMAGVYGILFFHELVLTFLDRKTS